MKAKDFSLPDQSGKIHKLSNYRGKWVVLYFYPKDDTPGCTKEACGFRDAIEEFNKKGVVIVGISKDSVESHKKFSEKYHLNFPILSDVDKKVIQAYGVWGEKKFLGKTFMGTLRNTYLIDPKRNIIKTFEKVNPLTHPQEVLKGI
ncbi:thioredoxin-dependent thiol peroxidase [Candidatus Roizmanbacteria bacterium]|nr:thioredoxin-dependent thiol peroxidase [Candidatus Roizmanbacteria bacterium]